MRPPEGPHLSSDSRSTMDRWYHMTGAITHTISDYKSENPPDVILSENSLTWTISRSGRMTPDRV